MGGLQHLLKQRTVPHVEALARTACCQGLPLVVAAVAGRLRQAAGRGCQELPAPLKRPPSPALFASLPWLADCKDKFLVQCVKLGSSDAKEVTPDMFDATKQKDIRCVRLGWEPGVAASPVHAPVPDCCVQLCGCWAAAAPACDGPAAAAHLCAGKPSCGWCWWGHPSRPRRCVNGRLGLQGSTNEWVLAGWRAVNPVMEAAAPSERRACPAD